MIQQFMNCELIVLLPDPPSPFVVEWAAALGPQLTAPRRLLDVAMGRGRHALVCAGLGYRVFGVDVNLDAVRAATGEAERRGLRIRSWCADLTATPLPRERFEAVVVTRYLQRDLFAPIRDAVTPGGIVLYETFTSQPARARRRTDIGGPPARAWRAARTIRRVRRAVLRGSASARGGRAAGRSQTESHYQRAQGHKEEPLMFSLGVLGAHFEF